jgi:hypothetical protein
MSLIWVWLLLERKRRKGVTRAEPWCPHPQLRFPLLRAGWRRLCRLAANHLAFTTGAWKSQTEGITPDLAGNGTRKMLAGDSQRDRRLVMTDGDGRLPSLARCNRTPKQLASRIIGRTRLCGMMHGSRFIQASKKALSRRAMFRQQWTCTPSRRSRIYTS